MSIIPDKTSEITVFVRAFRSYLMKLYCDDFFIGTIFHDQNTITYFPFTPRSLKEQKLKIAIVFNHPENRFEIWLAAQNKQIQSQYWKIFNGSDWKKYHVPASYKDGFSIVDHILIEKPSFTDTERLQEHMLEEILGFIKDIENVLL